MILVTGCAGFIGYHFSEKILKKKHKIIGLDNLNNYYSLKLKKDRLEKLKKYNNFKFYKIDLANYKTLEKLFKKNKISKVVHFAAQAGVRYSLDHPDAYLKSNLVGFFNILELSRIYKIKHLVFSSTSSVYGSNIKIPFEEKDKSELPKSFYAASKKSNEVMAYAYSELFKINSFSFPFSWQDEKYLVEIIIEINKDIYEVNKNIFTHNVIEDKISENILNCKILTNDNIGLVKFLLICDTSIKILNINNINEIERLLDE